MSKSLAKFRKFCLENNITVDIKSFLEGTRTAIDAAAALKTDVGNIVKSLLFLVGGEPVLVLMTGDKKVAVKKLAALLRVDESQVVKADADTTRIITGYPVGGIPPFGHDRELKTVMDEEVAVKPECFVAAGTPHSLFAISGARLKEIVEPIVDEVGE